MALPRTLEPEVMDTPQEAADYDAMDHSGVNRLFVDDLLAFAQAEFANPSAPIKILDVGSGTALIPIELCQRSVPVRVTAIDLSEEMLKVAATNVAASGFQEQIIPQRVDAKGLPFAEGEFDMVISNSIVHHIPQPGGVRAEIVRVTRRGGVIFRRELLRPETAETVEELVATYAAEENDHQRQLFHQSLHAALTVAEMRDLLTDVELSPDCCAQTSDRHWTIAARRGS